MEYEKVNTLFDSDEAEYEHKKELSINLQGVACSMIKPTHAIPCLLCGKGIPNEHPWQSGQICKECQKLWQEIKEEREHHG